MLVPTASKAKNIHTHPKQACLAISDTLKPAATCADLLPENWSSYYESPTAHNGHKEDSLWAKDTPRSRSSASSGRRRQGWPLELRSRRRPGNSGYKRSYLPSLE